MSEAAFDAGTPSWVDLSSPDIQASAAFYGDIFGWEGQDMGEEAGHYTIVFVDGKHVAAISPAQDPGPPRWTTYVNVDDADDVTAKAAAAGGTVVVAPRSRRPSTRRCSGGAGAGRPSTPRPK